MTDNSATSPSSLRRPRLKAPPGACDTHIHLYGPYDRYPLAPGRFYDPDQDAPLESYLETLDRLGLERAVIVTGGGNGTDNRVTLDAIAAMKGRFKGVALIEPTISDKDLTALARGGITGFRTRANGKGALNFADARRIAPRVKDFGWHVEFHVQTLDDALDAIPHLKALRLPFVLDHLAHLGPEIAPDDPRLRRLLDVFKGEENCWINLYSFYQRSHSGLPDYRDMIPVVETLVAARPDRLMWGTNWPHVFIKVPKPDDADLLDFMLAAVPDETVRTAILSGNPARLYGWSKP